MPKKINNKQYKIRPAEDRFIEKIIFTEKCWLWPYSPSARYGNFGTREIFNSSHRFSYELFVGKIENGLTIDHLCGNKRCVNPGHLEAVTSRINTLRCPDAPATKNINKTHCPKGHEYSKENTYIYKNKTYLKNGGRHCITCSRERTKQWRILNKSKS